MKAKKLLAVLLAAIMVASVFAVTAFAAGKEAVTHVPDKTDYSVGDFFDPAGLKIKDTKGSTRTYKPTTAEGKKFSFVPSLTTPLKVTDKVVEVYYNNDYIGEVEITVSSLDNITIQKQPKITEYLPGEKFNPSGLTLTNSVEYTAGSADFAFEPSLTTPLTAASTAVKVIYKGTNVGNVTITMLDSAAIVGQPTKTAYLAGETFEPNGLTIKIGNRANIIYTSLTGADFSFVPSIANPLAADVSSVKVYYVSNYIGDIPVEVYSVLTNPAKTVYNPEEFFDPSGLVLRCGTTEIPYTAGDANFSFTPALDTPLKSSDNTVAVLYKGMKIADLSFSVNGVITYPSKEDYTVGQEIDGSGLVVKYNGSTVTYPSSRLTLETNSGKSTITLSDNKISIYCDGDFLGEYTITVEGLTKKPDANQIAVEGKKFNPAGLLVTKYKGAIVAYEDDPVNFKFSPSIDEPVLQRDKNNKVLKDENGKILPVTYTVYYKGAEVGTFEITVNHDFGKCVQLESGKEHAKICKYCGELGDLDVCEAHTHNFKANDDAGLFTLQTETGTCDVCGGTVTRTIPDSNKFNNIFDFVHEDGMAQTEMTILEIFRAVILTLVQMIIPV